jgi:hypothetical protein
MPDIERDSMVDATAAERVEERLANAVWAGPVSALRCVPLSAYAADGKPATYSKEPAVHNGSGDCTVGKWAFYTDPVSPVTLYDFFARNLADW